MVASRWVCSVRKSRLRARGMVGGPSPPLAAAAIPPLLLLLLLLGCGRGHGCGTAGLDVGIRAGVGMEAGIGIGAGMGTGGRVCSVVRVYPHPGLCPQLNHQLQHRSWIML